MPSITVPQIMPKGDKWLYEDDQIELLIGNDGFEGELRLSMYVKEHEEFSDVVPDVTRSCSIVDSGEPSTLAALPSEYVALFRKAERRIASSYGLEPMFDEVTCIECVPNENGDGFLTFEQHFE